MIRAAGAAFRRRTSFIQGGCLLAFGILLTWAGVANAARVSLRDGVIYVEGDLVSGDSDRVVASARPQARDRDEFILDIDSTGGDLKAGMDLAIVVSLNHFPVRVRFGSVCYGSCFSIFAAAPKRLVSTPARVGVNRPQRNGAEAEPGATSRLIELYAKLGVRQSIQNKLRNTPSDQIGLLNEEEMRSLGPFEETRFDQEDVALKLVLEQLQQNPEAPLPSKEELAAMEQPLLSMMPPLESQAFWDWYDQHEGARTASNQAAP